MGVKKSLSRAASAIAGKLSILLVLHILLIAAVVAGAVIGLSIIREYVVRLPEHKVNVESINIANRPAWAPKGLGAEVRRAMPAEASIFDRSLPERVYQACKSLYWVDDVSQVRKVYPNTIELKLQLRKPAAYVMDGSTPYLTDDKGKRLPRDYYRKGPDVPSLPRIKGVKGPAPGPGEEWGDIEALLAALSTVADIAGNESVGSSGITTIDVDNYGGRIRKTKSHVILWTDKQTQILWGRSSRDRMFDDLTARDKLLNIRMARKEYGDLANMEYVNVYSRKNQCPGKYRRLKPR